jgi:tRNA 2-thiouridine synthesizing protein B
MLHLVNKSPFDRNSLKSCLATALPGAPVLLLEDGVYGALKGTAFSADLEEAMKQRPLYVMGPDLEARGIADKALDGVTVVDYGGFVDLVAEHGTVQSWL